MKRLIINLFIVLTGSCLTAQQVESYDYYSNNREMINNGIQSLLMCNGLFTSERTLEQVYAQELKFLRNPIGSAKGGDYKVDWKRKTIAIGSPGGTPVMRTAYREGLGCIIMAPDQTFEDIDNLPILPVKPNLLDPQIIPWPQGDMVIKTPLHESIDKDALTAAADWTFNRVSPEQVSLSLIVVHKGQIILEKYADGVNKNTKTRTWSTAKSIGVSLIGILVDEGKMSLDQPLGIEWLPKEDEPESDPRSKITLRHVLNMSSGLYTVDNRGMSRATGSGLSYFAGGSSSQGARNRGLIRTPGSYWDYENYDTILAILAMKKAIGNQQSYLEYPRKSLLGPLGMRSTILSVDRFGDFILSSQIYTTARDLARFGLLYLQNGLWNNKRILSQEWIDFVRTPAPSTESKGNFYGGQWWLVPDNRTDIPKDAYSTAGNRGQYVIVVPSHDLVIVRRGLDYGRQGFNRWDLLREVLKAF